MKRISLGLPLTIFLAGTIGSLVAGSKQAHIAFGMALTGLSLIHAFQNRKAMLGAWACKPVLPVRKPVLPRRDVLDRLPCVRNPFPGHGEVVFLHTGTHTPVYPGTKRTGRIQEGFVGNIRSLPSDWSSGHEFPDRFSADRV